MKRLRILFLFGFLITFLGCKKEDDSIEEYRIKSCTITNGTYSTTFMYEYTEDGNIEREIDQDGVVVNYTYSDSNIVATNGAGDLIGVYTLDNQGYVSKSIIGGVTRIYLYDSEGHVIKAGNEIYTWVDGNMVNNNNGYAVYSYINDRKNSIGNINRGMKYLGVDSKNLFSSIDFGTSIRYFDYKYDSKGRVSVRSYDNISATFTYY